MKKTCTLLARAGSKMKLLLLVSIFPIFGYAQVSPVQSPPQTREIRGTVSDNKGEALIGVTVVVKGTTNGAATDANGRFRISVPQSAKKSVLAISYIGMKGREVEISENTQDIRVVLEDDIRQISEVVVTGIMGTRDKATFTSAATSVTGNELRAVGTQSAIQALSTLDPSFSILENNLRGSDPNTMPEIEIRGRTGISLASQRDELGTDPNQPLLIMDGFPISLERFNDLDINRIASITLLKDAGSTAIYGSKASNGVVIIETVRPQAGHVKIDYRGRFEVSVPDFSSYNLMNASEKLEFERLAGRFTLGTGPGKRNSLNQYELDELYNHYLSQVQSGVNTYWLNEPIRTSFTNKHTVSANGGSDALTYDVTVSYGNEQGVMKGDLRRTYEGSVFLGYRKGKINVTNKISINGYDSEESPYREFRRWTSANPYYKKTNDDGTVSKYLEHTSKYSSSIIKNALHEVLQNTAGSQEVGIVNPLWDMQQGMIDKTNNFEVTDQFRLIYNVSSDFTLEGNFNIKKANTDRTQLKPYGLSDFESQTDELKKGSGFNSYRKDLNYEGSIRATYAKVINGHTFTGNLRGSISQTDAKSTKFNYIGFPEGVQMTPSLAIQYPDNYGPTSLHSPKRIVGSVATFNYNYLQRYLFDATFNYEGTSSFGRNNNFRPFWSLGAGWNLSNEEFMKDVKWMNMFKLRANYGTSSNASLMSNTYTVMRITNLPSYFGAAYQVNTFGNPDLKWPLTSQFSSGIDMAFLNNRITATLDYYDKLTDPIVVDLTTAPSTGMSTYSVNCGTLHVKGFEFKLNGVVINDIRNGIRWTVSATGSKGKSTYGDFGAALERINEGLRDEQRKNLTDDPNLARFMDGFSPYDIWAVKSLGIDPATGKELFLKKNGEVSYEYDIHDEVKIGSKDPKLGGFFSTNFIYKNFSLNANFEYSYGGDELNKAVYDKVENIRWGSIGDNLDRRALYARWKKAGDVSEFKALELTNKTPTPMTSRFLQRNNFVNFSYLSLTYKFSNLSWLNKYGIQGLSISANTSNIFRISTIKTERGLDYPFARKYSLNVNISF